MQTRVHGEELICGAQSSGGDAVLDVLGGGYEALAVCREDSEIRFGRQQELPAVVEWLEVEWQLRPVGEGKRVASGLLRVGIIRGHGRIDESAVLGPNHKQALARLATCGGDLDDHDGLGAIAERGRAM